MAEISSFVEGFFKKIIEKGNDIREVIEFRNFFQNKEWNVLLITRGYIFADKNIHDDGVRTVSIDKLPKGLLKIKLPPQEYDEPDKYLIYNPLAVDVKEFVPYEIRHRKGAPKIEHQELLDAGWTVVGAGSDRSIFIRQKPHAVMIPEDIKNDPAVQNLLSEK